MAKRRFNFWPYALILLLLVAIVSLVYLSGARAPLPVTVGERSWYIDSNRYADSAHGRFACVECHLDYSVSSQAHPDADHLDSDATILADQLRCARCHPGEFVSFLSGHERLRGRRDREIPGCGDCHDIHYQKAQLSRAELGAQIAKNCGRCHPKELKGYLNDYHGKTAINFGYSGSAYCQDCHGGHDLFPVARQSLMLARCRRCHEEFTGSALDYVIHVKDGAGGKKDSTIESVKKWMLVFIVVVLAFFYLHMSMWGLRLWHERVRKNE